MLTGRPKVLLIAALTILGVPHRVDAQPKFELTSTAFANGAAIPSEYTCVRADRSPPLLWTGTPRNVKSFAIVVTDPDAPNGTFTHWIIYGLPSATERLDDVPKSATLTNGASQGVNDFGSVGYRGPCPPPGPTHHYHFRLLALDSTLTLDPGATAAMLDSAARSHVIATAELIGTFAR